MKILILGSGGREHALSWKLAQDPNAEKIFVLPGNDGIALENKVTLYSSKKLNIEEVKRFCQKENIDLVVVGPENYLADGVVDDLKGVTKVFGPTKKAAQLESSKIFCKKILEEANAPTAGFKEFIKINPALEFVDHNPWNDQIVVKVDGLAQGKGVVVCSTKGEAKKAIFDFLENTSHPVKAKKILLEQRLEGKEVSAFALCDGETFAWMGAACDYKRLQTGDIGPNTGGMGAYSPVSWMDNNLKERICRDVFLPVLKTLKKRGIHYQGVLFAGLMVDNNGLPNVLEFNVRFGDPETQVLLPLIDESLLPWLYHTASGTLAEFIERRHNLRLSKKFGVHVVMAAKGYPGTEGNEIQKGDKIEIKNLENLKDAKLFFAGVKAGNTKSELITDGGRILGLTALGVTMDEARGYAYTLIKNIKINEVQYRHDIAK